MIIHCYPTDILPALYNPLKHAISRQHSIIDAPISTNSHFLCRRSASVIADHGIIYIIRCSSTPVYPIKKNTTLFL